jgi:ribosomal protein S18 acetylase RimI-like enzyme
VPSLDAEELLALMDQNLVATYAADTRATPGGEVVEVPGLVMCRTPYGTVATNMAIVTGPIDAARVRDATASVYGADRPFAVWTREHADGALEEELRASGFQEIHREPGMVWLPDATILPPAQELSVRPVVDDVGRAEYGRLMATAFGVYGAPEDSTLEHFAAMAAVRGPATQAYLAYEDGRAVAGATLYMAHGVGGIGWVGTDPAFFRRGWGRIVTGAVIAAGMQRGARFMNLQASPMGEPMYRRMGFLTPTRYGWFIASW